MIRPALRLITLKGRGRRALTQPPDQHDLDAELMAAVGRRGLTTILRLVGTLDDAQREDPDPATLALLYQIDHGLAQARRTFENLLTLSGVRVPVSINRPLSLLDVARAAVAECGDFAAVNVLAMPEAFVHPSAVDAVSHILAELIDNALAASAGRPVALACDRRADMSVCYRVDDAGPRPRPGALEALNERLARAPQLSAETPRHMGLYVIALHADRLGVRVRLAPGAGGVSAYVLLPAHLIVDAPPPARAQRIAPARAGVSVDRWGAAPAVPPVEEHTPGGLPRRVRTTASGPAPSTAAAPLARPHGPAAMGAASALTQARRSADRARPSETRG